MEREIQRGYIRCECKEGKACHDVLRYVSRGLIKTTLKSNLEGFQ